MSRNVRHGSRLEQEAFEFSFDGRPVPARRGDTAASALLAHGVRLLGRSMKYRRMRGVLTSGFEEPSALFALSRVGSTVPNIPGPALALYPGAVITSQNRWPTLRYDLGALLQLGAGTLGAGFYYKTFMWPSWRAYEALIRRLAGLGPAPHAETLPQPAVEHLTCDALVAGGGPAGLAAALAAARAGARVVLCERDVVCGGELEFEDAEVESLPASAWIAATLKELRARSVRVLTDTAIVGGADGLVVALCQPGAVPGLDQVYRIRPRTVINATGASERPIAFADNDRPGVMLMGAAECYLARYGVHVGKNVILFGNHDRLYFAAARMLGRGMRVGAVIDTRAQVQAGAAQGLRAELARAGVDCLLGHAVLGTSGAAAIASVRIAPLDAPNAVRTLACDALLVSGGWSPRIHAGLHEGGAAAFVPQIAAFRAAEQPSGRRACGAANGTVELGAALLEGYVAGCAALQAPAVQTPARAPQARADAAPALEPFWRSPAPLASEKRQFVDLQNDVTVADLRQALDEGFSHIEHIKRYTTLGVGTDQGRFSSELGAAIVAELSGRTLPKVGLYRTRPPYQPVTLMALTGHRFGKALRPTRCTPLHSWHSANGGVLEPADLWLRPRFYGANGADSFSAGLIEAARVRAHGGIFDGSTLGKIEVAGADAAAFLDRMYLTQASTLRVGRSKYVVALREDGMVLDDGILLRLAEDRYLATTSSSHAEHVLSHFEFWRATEWPRQRVILTDVTEVWSVIVCAGPQSRATLRDVLGVQWTASLDALTHMEFASGFWGGGALRVLRASFSGELAFELHCRAGNVAALWSALGAAAMDPYGLEALDILRVEKGYLSAAELNGETAPQDLGLERLLNSKNDCIGRNLLQRPAFSAPDRPRLVGLEAADGSATFLGGAQLTTKTDARHARGHVTSSVYSPHLRRWIGLALLARDLAQEGQVLLARDPLRKRDSEVRVSATVHFDAAGERMKS